MKAYMEQQDDKTIDIKRNRYPYCIVWTPLPMITALFPFIGHTGICTSEGIIHDFSGSYSITEDDMAFGNPTKYVELDIQAKDTWDEHVYRADEHYRGETHNLCCNNCHSHVAMALNNAGYKAGGWNMINVALTLVLHGKYTGFSGFFKTYIGFFVVLIFILVIAIVRW